MAEDNADIMKPEGEPMTRVDRIKAGIGKWVESQMPPAIAERYKKTFTVFAEKLTNKPELLDMLAGPIEAAAKVAGWADPMIKVAVTSAALYGGVSLLLNPDIVVALGSSAVVLGKQAVVAGTAAAVGAYHYVVDGAMDLGNRVKGVFDKLMNPPIPGSGGIPHAAQ